MDFTELVLAGMVNQLSEEIGAREHADAISFEVNNRDDIRELNKYSAETPIIATAGYGKSERRLNIERRIENIEQAAKLDSVEAVDINYDIVKKNPEILDSLRETDVEIIVSYRDYSDTQKRLTLLSIVKEAAEYGDVVYIETTAQKLDDALTLLTIINEATNGDIRIGGIARGEIGRHTRVIAPAYGSKLAYAPVNEAGRNVGSDEYSLKELAKLIKDSEEPCPPTSLHDKITNPMLTDDQEIE
ncbi:MULTISPECIES: type I 3-dehydroquinate dehydratase [Halorussus]|uniref:type I 3-dehydroquinate dehydratase n=1 Tax=Halorussus TaxID=1070314 RepID=UPI0020A01550|nr:type I 3-dehydroquinate dehydratase [Halorussus vallis]USZ74997.1 type I 3-dehydroquinate dehydratase [Halorussus vallis]